MTRANVRVDESFGRVAKSYLIRGRCRGVTIAIGVRNDGLQHLFPDPRESANHRSRISALVIRVLFVRFGIYRGKSVATVPSACVHHAREKLFTFCRLFSRTKHPSDIYVSQRTAYIFSVSPRSAAKSRLEDPQFARSHGSPSMQGVAPQ